jgi:hypothetical protein
MGTPLPVATSSERQCDNQCGRHSCHHNPCQLSNPLNNRSTHCSHHSPCQSFCSHGASCQCHAAKPPTPNPVNPSNRSHCLNKPTPPLSTARLKASRQRTKNAICSILEQGEVCLEFIRKVKETERIVDVCRISGDGMRVSSDFSSFFCKKEKKMLKHLYYNYLHYLPSYFIRSSFISLTMVKVWL